MSRADLARMRIALRRKRDVFLADAGCVGGAGLADGTTRISGQHAAEVHDGADLLVGDRSLKLLARAAPSGKPCRE